MSKHKALKATSPWTGFPYGYAGPIDTNRRKRKHEDEGESKPARDSTAYDQE